MDDVLQARGVNDELIGHTIHRANGVEELFTEYLSLGNPPPALPNVPICRNTIISQLACIRNGFAHAGRVPTAKETARAVELAQPLVIAVHPYP